MCTRPRRAERITGVLMREPDELHVLTLIDGLGWGGAEMLLADLVAAAPAAGLRLSVAYLHEREASPAAARLRAVGVVPVPVLIDRLLSVRSVRRVRRHIAELRPDVVHTHLGYSDFLGGLAARSLGIPAVSTIHLTHWNATDGRRDALKEWLFAQARRRCMSRVLAVSDAARDSYLEWGWDRPDRVITVHNGVRDAVDDDARAAIRNELGVGGEDFLVTIVSVLRERKGHRAAIEAIDELSRSPHTRHARLLVVGDGPAREEIRALAAPLGNHVIMAGHRDDVPALLQATDVLLHPSLQDAFPTVLLEAMAAGIPVVATNVGGIPEITVPGVTGVLVQPPPTGGSLAEALRPLIQDRRAREAQGRAGRDRYRRLFTADAWAARLRCVYADVLASRSR